MSLSHQSTPLSQVTSTFHGTPSPVTYLSPVTPLALLSVLHEQQQHLISFVWKEYQLVNTEIET